MPVVLRRADGGRSFEFQHASYFYNSQPSACPRTCARTPINSRLWDSNLHSMSSSLHRNRQDNTRFFLSTSGRRKIEMNKQVLLRVPVFTDSSEICNASPLPPTASEFLGISGGKTTIGTKRVLDATATPTKEPRSFLR